MMVKKDLLKNSERYKIKLCDREENAWNRDTAAPNGISQLQIEEREILREIEREISSIDNDNNA